MTSTVSIWMTVQRFSKRLNSTCNYSQHLYLRRCHHHDARDSDVWELSKYRYFFPCQSRWTDNDENGHVNNGIYSGWSGLMFRSFVTRYINTENTDMYFAKVSFTHRMPLIYPEIALGGLSVSRIGNSSVLFKMAFFKPISPAVDPALEFCLSLSGDYANDIDMSAIFKQYLQTPATLARIAVVFVHSQTKNPVSELPTALKSGLNGVMLT